VREHVKLKMPAEAGLDAARATIARQSAISLAGRDDWADFFRRWRVGASGRGLKHQQRNALAGQVKAEAG
jgi:hypothetical protein